MPTQRVLQFKVTLAHIEPKVWRRFQIPEEATFWDLHVAIQDTFGWEDRHLHEFTVPTADFGVIRLGLPDPDGSGESQPFPDWVVSVVDLLEEPGASFMYVYDFGDEWEHTVEFEDSVPATAKTRYPVLIDGKNACPPEDVGGSPGYIDFIEALANPAHEMHKELKAWIGRPFDPRKFDPTHVKFSDPKKRMKAAGLKPSKQQWKGPKSIS